MKTWAFLFASIGVLFGIWIMVRDKKWQIGSWLVGLSMAVFFGASVQIQSLISVSDAFKYQQQVAVLTNQVAALSSNVVFLQVQVTQALAIAQSQQQHQAQGQSQTINLITQVQKEVADVRETVSGMLKLYQSEKFIASDTNRFATFAKGDGGNVVFCKLDYVPFAGSVQVIVQLPGLQVPIIGQSLTSQANLIAFILAKGVDVNNVTVFVAYLRDPENKNRFDLRSWVNQNRLLLNP